MPVQPAACKLLLWLRAAIQTLTAVLHSQPAISPDGKYAFSVVSVTVNATDVATPILVTDLSSGKVRHYHTASHCHSCRHSRPTRPGLAKQGMQQTE